MIEIKNQNNRTYLNLEKAMENENEVNLIEEVDQELRILNTPVKDRKTNNSQGCLSTP